MTRKRAALGIDLGSTNAKAMAVAEDGAVLATGTAATGFSYPGPGLVEMDLTAAWDAAAGAGRGVADDARRQGYEISCVGLSALGPALVLLDAAGDPVRPAIAYSDLRAAADAREIAACVDVATQVRLSGVRWAPGMASAPVLRWIQREEPEAYAKATVVGHPSTFLLHRLTGRFAIDHAAAQTTGLFAYQGEPRWLPEAAQAMDVALEKLPEPVDAVSAAGTLTAKAAATLGLEPGIPVSAGANDPSCAAVALAIMEPGRLGFLLGTTNAVATAVAGPRFGPEFVMRRSIVAGQWLAVGATVTGGASMDWLLRLLDIETGDPAEVDALVGDAWIERGSPFFLPHLAGERSPLWDPAAQGTLHGLNLATDRRALLLAGIEGNAFALREVLEAMRDRFGLPASEALVTGSQARGARFMQALADVTQLRLRVAAMDDAAPLGAALLGRVAAGECTVEDLRAATVPVGAVVEPTAGAGDMYDERFARYREIYAALRTK